jgi:hypothetical protein
VKNGVLNSEIRVFNSDFGVPNSGARVIYSDAGVLNSDVEVIYSDFGLRNSDFVPRKYYAGVQKYFFVLQKGILE